MAGSGNEVLIATTDDGGEIYIALGFSAAYFMGEPALGEVEAPMPSVYIVYANSTNDIAVIDSDEEAIAQAYGIRIISYEYDEPIENSFG